MLDAGCNEIVISPISMSGGEPVDLVSGIDESYRLVVKGLTRNQREGLRRCS